MTVSAELFANQAQSAVTTGGQTSPASGTSETWVITAPGPFPLADPTATPPTQFRVTDPALPSEKMIVSDSRTSSWIVIRGAEGTSPAVHSPGFSIEQVVTAGSLEALFQSGSALGGDLTGTLPRPTVARLNGLAVGLSPGGTADFLRADGQWTAPPGGGSGSVSQATFTASGLGRQLEYNIADFGAVGDAYSSGTTYNTGCTDNTIAIRAAFAAAGGTGGTVVIPPFAYMTDTVTVPDNVSVRGATRKASALVLKPTSATGCVLISAGFGTGNAATSSDDAFAGISYPNFASLSLDGNQVNATVASGQSDYRNQWAVLKLYAWHFIIRDVEIRNARENGLYTEHAANWETSFDDYQFGESVIENLFVKNFGGAGWCNRGPHDSRAASVYLSSYNAGGTNAYAGYVQEGNGNYGSSGMILHNLHAWGQFSTNAVYVSGSNILDGFIYAEGSSGSAIYLDGVSGSKFSATVGYCTAGIELDASCSDNHITAGVQSNVTAALFRLDGAAAGNTLNHVAYSGGPGTAIFDLASGSYTGGNNTFTTSHPYGATLFSGTPALNDKIDARSDNYPLTSSSTTWQLPVRDKALTISDASGSPQVGAAGFGLAIGSTDTSSGATASTPALVSGTAAQLSTTSDVILYLNVKIASTVALSIGPTSSAATALVASGTAGIGLMTVRVPRGWYVRATFTSADVAFAQVTC